MKTAKEILEQIENDQTLSVGDIVISEQTILKAMELYADQFRQAAVSGSLPLAESLLSSIESADPNVIDNPKMADMIIKDLHKQCKNLVKCLGGNDR